VTANRGIAAAAAVLVLVLVLVGGGYELTRSHHSTPAAALAKPIAIATPAPRGVIAWHQPTATLQGTLVAAMANALEENSVHVVITNRAQGHGVSVSSQEDGVTDGVQRVTAGRGRVVIRVVGTTTYFTANRIGFIKYFRFTPAQASEVRGQWVPLTQGEPGYASVTDAVTLSSMLQELAIGAPFKRLPTRVIDGQHVFGIQGKATGDGEPAHTRGTVWIRVGVHPIPVEFTVITKKFSTIARLSDWAAPINVPVPTAIIGTQQQGVSS
jgi:hypothetical protein